MPLHRFIKKLSQELAEFEESGTSKGNETIVREIVPAHNGSGPRVLLSGAGTQQFLRMNSNSYLGMSLRQRVVQAEEEAARKFGVGPGAVRFISGTFEPHVRLEERLAKFHGREACMVTSSAYTSIMGLIVTLTTPETIIISDELNHNSIINAMRLARPKDKKVYQHRNMVDLEFKISDSIGCCDSILIITDGVFSMRGVYAPLDEVSAIVKKYDDRFPRGIVLIVDDSHGIGAIGRTGRGTEEMTGADEVDIVVATLGKALGSQRRLHRLKERSGSVPERKEPVLYLHQPDHSAGSNGGPGGD